MTNYGIEEDAEDPKEPAHLDYKYIKSFAGPLAATPTNKSLRESRESAHERSKLLKRKQAKPKVIYSYERKKYGGIRMCQRCLRTKVKIISLIPLCSLTGVITALNVISVSLRWITTAHGLRTVSDSTTTSTSSVCFSIPLSPVRLLCSLLGP